MFCWPGINGAVGSQRANAGAGREKRPCVRVSRLEGRRVNPPQKSPAVVSVRGREKQEVARELVECWLFLRCGFSRLREKIRRNLLRVNRMRQNIRGAVKVARESLISPSPRSGWRRKLRALPRRCREAFLDGDKAMASCSPGRFYFAAAFARPRKRGSPGPWCGLRPRCPLTSGGICGLQERVLVGRMSSVPPALNFSSLVSKGNALCCVGWSGV